MPNDGIHPEQHLGPSELAAYLDNQLAPADRARVEAHLTGCDECRAESAAVVQVLSARPRVRRRWAILLPAALAAAAAIVLLVIRPLGNAPNSAGDSMRNGAVAGREGVPEIEVLSPLAEAMRLDSVLFAWRPANPNALYHLVLSDTLGDVVWQRETRDTMLILPSAVRLERGRTYFWRVDALLTEGRSASTQTQRFRTAP